MRQLLGLLLLMGLTACNTDIFVSATSPVEPTPLSSQTPMPMVSPLPSITPSPESAVAPDILTPTNAFQTLSSTRTLTNVASGDIQAVWWSQDSNTLFYGVPYQNLAYDIERETAQELPLEELYEQTPEPQTFSQLPPEAIRIYVSPSRNSALYFKIIRLSQTPTPSETAEMGEYTTRGTIAELWFQEEGGYRSKIGKLEFCGFDDAFWTNDELKVVIPRGPSISLCGETYAWLVDILFDARTF